MRGETKVRLTLLGSLVVESLFLCLFKLNEKITGTLYVTIFLLLFFSIPILVVFLFYKLGLYEEKK
jgi:hypothetical protein